MKIPWWFYIFGSSQCTRPGSGIYRMGTGIMEPMCTPIAQAEVLNTEKVDLAILLGLCVGHDTLFLKYCHVPCTVLAVKDRVLGHNPLAAPVSLQGALLQQAGYARSGPGRKTQGHPGVSPRTPMHGMPLISFSVRPVPQAAPGRTPAKREGRMQGRDRTPDRWSCDCIWRSHTHRSA
jgi:hypothetical protein